MKKKMPNKVLVSALALVTLVPCIKAETTDNSKAQFDVFAPNNALSINAIRPTSDNDVLASFNEYVEKNPVPSDYHVSFEWGSCDSTYDSCNVSICYKGENKYCGSDIETRKVQFTWANRDENAVKLVSEANKKLEELNAKNVDGQNHALNFEFTDLDALNVYKNINGDLTKTLNYIEGFNSIFGNSGLTYKYDASRSTYEKPEDTILGEWVSGRVNLYYNDTLYSVQTNMRVDLKNVLYIPDETENTAEAFIAAAKKRIDEALNVDSKIEVAGKRDDFSKNQKEFTFEDLGNVDNMGDYFYLVTIGNVTEAFVFERNSSKMSTLEPIVMQDNGVIVVAPASVPTDTKLIVTPFAKDSDDFKNIINKLHVSADKAITLDISLYSESTKQYITKLENDEFVVSVPIIDSLKGKKLVAIYITDEGKLERHSVTVEDDMATFTTNHFTPYTIMEDNGIGVPNTYDGIMNFVVIGFVGLIGLGAYLSMKKSEN